MNYSIDKVTTPKGELKHQLRVWWPGRKAPQRKRRFDSRKEALAELDRLLREERAPKDSLDRMFGDEYRFWREQNDEEFSPGWKANLDGYWRECEAKLERCSLTQLEPKLAVLKTEWAELSQKTKNNKIGFIHSVLNFSVERKRISHNPLGSFIRPNKQEADIEFWERQEAESFLSYLEERYPREHEERWRFAAVLTPLNTAIRAGENWGMRVSDLKPSLSSIRLTRQFNRVSKEFAQLKGKKARSVPLNAELLFELERLVKGRKHSDLIFIWNRKPVDHDTFADWFDDEVARWGGRRITFHGLRHTAATLMLLAGVDVKSLQDIMGHKDIKTTMKYVHAIGDAASRVAQAFSVKAQDNVLRLSDYG